jgi:hypothetical protein
VTALFHGLCPVSADCFFFVGFRVTYRGFSIPLAHHRVLLEHQLSVHRELGLTHQPERGRHEYGATFLALDDRPEYPHVDSILNLPLPSGPNRHAYLGSNIHELSACDDLEQTSTSA